MHPWLYNCTQPFLWAYIFCPSQAFPAYMTKIECQRSNIHVLLNYARAWQRFIAAVAFTSQLDSLHDLWNNLRGGSFCAALLILMGKKRWLVMVMIQTASFIFMKPRNCGIVVSWMIWVLAIVGAFILVTASKHFVFVIFLHLLAILLSDPSPIILSTFFTHWLTNWLTN